VQSAFADAPSSPNTGGSRTARTRTRSNGVPPFRCACEVNERRARSGQLCCVGRCGVPSASHFVYNIIVPSPAFAPGPTNPLLRSPLPAFEGRRAAPFGCCRRHPGGRPRPISSRRRLVRFFSAPPGRRPARRRIPREEKRGRRGRGSIAVGAAVPVGRFLACTSLCPRPRRYRQVVNSGAARCRTTTPKQAGPVRVNGAGGRRPAAPSPRFARAGVRGPCGSLPGHDPAVPRVFAVGAAGNFWIASCSPSDPLTPRFAVKIALRRALRDRALLPCRRKKKAKTESVMMPWLGPRSKTPDGWRKRGAPWRAAASLPIAMAEALNSPTAAAARAAFFLPGRLEWALGAGPASVEELAARKTAGRLARRRPLPSLLPASRSNLSLARTRIAGGAGDPEPHRLSDIVRPFHRARRQNPRADLMSTVRAKKRCSSALWSRPPPA